MTSEAQILANRRNARLSTGPNSPEGKEKSSKNARKRRLAGATPLMLSEDEGAFAVHYDGLRAALIPQDAFEAELVRQIALHQWRLGRLQRIEAALFDAAQHRADYRRRAYFSPQDLRNGDAPPGDIWPEGIDSLRYREEALERAVARSMALLERRQAARPRDGADDRAAKIPGDEANTSSDINGAG
jgi:hypothetical protein